MSSLGRRPLLLAIIVLSFTAIWILIVPSQSPRQWTSGIYDVARHGLKTKPLKPAKLHLLIAAKDSGIELCKTVLSATLLGYGVPTLYSRPEMDDETAWIAAPLKYLRALGGTNENDLVLIVEPSNTWFQLPPSVLIDRYHEINAKADERIRLATGSSHGAKSASKLRVVFGAQKRCWTEDESNLDCRAVPESMLPANVFGPDTDKILDTDELYRFQFVRPRWLNAGVMMGPVNELRLFLERAQGLIRDKPVVTYQAAFSQLFAEQEHASAVDVAIGASSVAASSNYSLALDYESSLSFSTIYAPYTTSFLTFSDSRSILRAMKANSIANAHSLTLETDISNLPAPFSTLESPNVKSIPAKLWYKSPQTPWSDVPLFTNFYTGITPVIVHRDDPLDGTFKSEKWREMWFRPMARELLDSRIGAAEEPIHVDKNGRQWTNAVGLFDIEREGFGVPVDNEDGAGIVWRQWNDLCGKGDQDDIFGDGKGSYYQDETVGG